MSENTAPIVVKPNPDHTFVGQNGLIYFLNGTFFDPDPGDQLVYSATLDDGIALPTWMSFNASSPYLLILGANALLGQYSIRLTATDTFGAQASDTFVLNLISPDLIIYGTTGNDTLRGSVGNDQLYGLDGYDDLYGNSGDDMLDGGAGYDVLNGDAGNDFLYGGDGSDVLNGGDGADVLDAGADYDVLRGGTGADQLSGAGGNDDLDGEGGDDVLYGGDGDDYLHDDDGANVLDGGAGYDVLRGGTGADQLSGAGGNDDLDGEGGDDVLNGGDGDDYLVGGLGGDVLTGGAGNDRLYGGIGNDILSGGTGSDTYYFEIGAGTDTIQIGAPDYATTVDSVVVAAPIGPADVEFRVHGQDLSMDVISSGDRLILSGALGVSAGEQIQFGFSDGSLVTVHIGSAAEDSFLSNAGVGIFVGGEGNDYLSGWSDSDIYIYTANGGVDLIDDFVEPGSGNELWFAGVGSAASISLSPYGTIRIDGQDVVRILQFNPGDVVGSNIIQTFRFEDGSVLTYQDLLARGIDFYPWDGHPTQGTNAKDRYHGLDGYDVFSAGDGDDELYGFGGFDFLHGDDGNDYIEGGDGNDWLYGDSGNDTLNGGAGSDVMVGGAGNDTYYVDDVGDLVIENPNEGIDQVFSSVNYTLTANVENLSLYGDADHATGNELVNILTGTAANDVLDGGLGADVLVGGLGNDTYVVDNNADVITELANQGIDLVQSSATAYALSANVENLALTGIAAINGTGNTLDNILTGNSGNNTLTGGAGNDALDGGAGNDVLDGGTGFDTLRGGTGNDTYVIADSMGGPTTITLHNWIVGQTSAYNADTGSFTSRQEDRNGDGQVDYIRVTYQDVNWPSGHYFDLEFTTTALGTNLAPGTYLDAQRASSASAGHPGLDLTGDGRGFGSLTGGFTIAALDIDYSGPAPILIDLSVDFSIIEYPDAPNITGTLNFNYAPAGSVVRDAVIENAGEGTDTVISAFSYVLGANVENLTLTGVGNLRGEGNGLDNVVTGNAADNALFGAAGNDTLSGGAGRDVLDGGTGVDVLRGDTGNDTYVINDAADSVVENALAGVDTVVSTLSYALTPNVEILTLAGSADINATGNDLGNRLIGNAGANFLSGGAGSDMLLGGAGNDVLDGGADLDTLQGGNGNDTYVINEAVVLGGTTSLIMNSEPGDDVGRGKSYSLSNQLYAPRLYDVTGDGLIDYIQFFFTDAGGPSSNFFSAYFSTASIGTPLAPGLYADAQRDLSAAPGHAGLDVSGNGSGANQVFGSFTINGVDIDYGGATPTLRYFSANFEQHGDSPSNPALYGSLIYNVEPAGATGIDVVIENAGEGNDTVRSSISYALTANVENLVLTGGSNIDGTGNSLDNMLTGNSGSNRLSGGAGNDTLDGGAGIDTLIGGDGDDTFLIDSAADIVSENAGEGTDLVQASLTYSLGENIENLALTGNAAINGTGNSLDNVLNGNSRNNVLTGGAGNDTLIGNGGTDTLVGGTGNDTYVVDSTTDVVTEFAGAGIDLILSSVVYTASANVENLTLTGIASINATGNALDNVITGNSANNTLTGGAGNDTIDGGDGRDTLVGGAGNDTYIVDSTTDTITELTGGGTDTVQSRVTLTLAANLENLALTGSLAINGTGNTLNNTLTGNSAGNTLNGGAGSDSMIGGEGDDTYIADSTGDVVTEFEGEGLDLVKSSATFSLGANVENLTLTGTSSINGTGNSLDNLLTGNSGNNRLRGGAGNDTMIGGGGDDTMVGGSGDDIYTVDSTSDAVTELAGEGSDLILASVSLTLSANVENLTLIGSTTINGTGNSLDNILTGNNRNNTLVGGGGNDTLIGLGGNDTLIGGTGNDFYVLDSTSDAVTENASEGIDTIQSSVAWTLGASFENLILTGSAAINGTGNSVANLLVGNSGGNVLTGAAGNDILQGMEGNDVLADSVDKGVLDGGDGNDLLTGNASNQLFIGGLGNDTITTGTGADIIAFNLESGQDVINASTGADNTISLGGGIVYGDLTFARHGSDLVLSTGGTDKLTFAGWYTGAANKSVVNMQVIAEAMSNFDPLGTDTLLDNKIERFSFTALANAFDSAGQVDGWALTNALLGAHLSGSDTAALGGDLAYQYGVAGALAGIGLTPAQDVVNAAGFGSSLQTLRPTAELQQGQIRLS